MIAKDHEAPSVAEPDSLDAIENAVLSPQENISINNGNSSISTQLATQSLPLLKPQVCYEELFEIIFLIKVSTLDIWLSCECVGFPRFHFHSNLIML